MAIGALPESLSVPACQPAVSGLGRSFVDFAFPVYEYSRLHVSVTAFYLLATVLAVTPLHRWRTLNCSCPLHVAVDIVVLTILMYAGGGLRSGFGVLLLVHWRGRARRAGRLSCHTQPWRHSRSLGAETYLALGGKRAASGLYRPGCCRQVSSPWPSLPVCCKARTGQ